jgi:TolA-binding protein
MERALYGRAFCNSRNRQPLEKIPEYQAKAIEGYEAFLKKYPTSDLAPSVLCNIGTLYYLLNKPEEAGKFFERLAKDFPDNPLAQNVLFAQVESLIQLGQTDKAGEILDKMIENAAKYKPSQFLKVGQDFMEAKQYASAAKALEKARAGSTERNIWEPASAALGQALQGTGQTDAAIKVIEELFAKYKTTSFTVQASMTLGRARAVLAQAENNPARKAELFKKAISAMYKAAGFVQDAGTRAELELEVAAMQLSMGEKNKSLGSYQRLFETSDPKLGVKVAACMEAAFAKMMPMLVESKRSKDIVASCDEYLNQFQNGKYRSEAISWRTQFSEAGSAKPVTTKAVETNKAETSPDSGTSTSKAEAVAVTVKAAKSVATNVAPTAETNKVTEASK